jgi:long-chain acyl-CoA synthetase
MVAMAVRFSNLVELCERSCRDHASRLFLGAKLAGSWWWIAYAEFLPLVQAFRGGLGNLGVGPGDAVAIVSDNRLEWAVACCGTYACGAALVPMYEAQTEQEWQLILADCGARVVVGSSAAISAKLRHMQPAIPTLAHVVGLELPFTDPCSYAALLDVGRRHPLPAESPAPEDWAGIIYIPGHAGEPKGVILSHGNMVSTVNAMHEIFALGPDDRSLNLVPWAHPFGQLCELQTLLSIGGSIAINDAEENVATNAADVQPTVLFGVPDLLDRLCQVVQPQTAPESGIIQRLLCTRVATASRRARGGRRLGQVDELSGGRLRYAVCGGGAPGQRVAESAEALGITVYEGYGTVETSSLVTVNSPGHRRMGSLGKAIPLVTIEIDRSVTGDATRGEVIVRGPNVMQGYHNRPRENAAVRTTDGGLRTGDIGYLDGDGYLFITGRIDEQ